MSFRIDDILKNDTISCSDNKETVPICEVNDVEPCLSPQYEKDTFSPTNNRSYSANQSYLDYWNQSYRLARIAAAASSLDGFRQNLLPSDQSPSCCTNSVYHQDTQNYYSSTYLYPAKNYPQSYNHMLPFSFAMCSHLSKRRNQVRFSPSQTKALENKFSWQKYLSPEDRKILAHSLKLSDRQVKTWFQNRRAKWRRNVSCSSTSSETKPHISSSAT